jgi:ribosome-associated protein
MHIAGNLHIDERELSETFIRATGPGGQNINKVSTAVQLRFDVVKSPSLPEEVRLRLIALTRARLTKDGVLIIIAQRFRTQERNRKDARDRLAGLIQRAMIRPKKRFPTAPSKGAKEDRLKSKAKRGESKRLRTRVSREDD